MAFDITVSRFMDFVQLSVTGPASMGGFVELVRSVENESHVWSDRKVLVDLRAVQGELVPDEQVFLGELVAQHFQHLDKVASVVPAEQITRNSENAARELGMRLRVFATKEEAIEWLQDTRAAADAPLTSLANS